MGLEKLGKKLLSRVAGLARSALTRSSAAPPPPPPAPPRSDPPPREPAAEAGELTEPIQTRTMARLLAGQGHHRRALAIYEKLLAARPGDAELRAEADETRSRAREHPLESDEVVAVPADAGALLVSWHVTDDGVERAGRLLGASGKLTARVVIVAPDLAQVVRSETRQRPVETGGEWLVPDVPSGARATVAVGLLDGDRFVSITHTRGIRT